MGCTCSKSEQNELLHLCKERMRFIKQSIDSRYALAATHVAYTQSLRNTGIALRRYAEAEVLMESSLSTSATDLEKSPSHCSFPSPSPTHNVSDSPLHHESPLSPMPVSSLSYMRTTGSDAVTFRLNPSFTGFGDHESMGFSMPPPPPHPDSASSWDYFDTNDDIESLKNVINNGLDHNHENLAGWRHYINEIADNNEVHEESNNPQNGHEKSSHDQLVVVNNLEKSDSKKEKIVEDPVREREDPSEFITHRAKDFLSSIKEIEHRFFRASESGKEVSRLLEANKIRVGYSESKGPSGSNFLATFHLSCCRGGSTLVCNEPSQNVTKVITWNRSVSSRSTSSKNPLTATSKDDNDDSGSDFMEEFCMIAGSHSSTLDRLFAWERKLYDEVKASESIRKEYDRKCEQLRHQFAKDLSTQIIDKTRANVKDLHSQLRVALHSVNSISKRIEKMRDEELQPQLVELIQGFTRMWKTMLECHHAQYITISLAYHSKTSTGTLQPNSQHQIATQLHHELECFSLSFSDWIKSHTSYIEALNSWLQNCILQPQQTSKSRRPFSPRRVLAPPIFVLCRDWSDSIRSLPSNELSEAVKILLFDLRQLMNQQVEVVVEKKHEETEGENVKKNEDSSSNLSCIHTSLTKVLDRMTKFSEASLKMYEDIRQKSEAAKLAYSNFRPNKF